MLSFVPFFVHNIGVVKLHTKPSLEAVDIFPAKGGLLLSFFFCKPFGRSRFFRKKVDSVDFSLFHCFPLKKYCCQESIHDFFFLVKPGGNMV